MADNPVSAWKIVALPFAIVWLLALTLASVPWFLVGLSFAVLGDDDRAAKIIENPPLSWWFDFLEEREYGPGHREGVQSKMTAAGSRPTR